MRYPHPSFEEIKEKLMDLRHQLDYEKVSKSTIFTREELNLLSQRLKYLIATVNLWNAPVYPPRNLHELLNVSKLIKAHHYEKKP